MRFLSFNQASDSHHVETKFFGGFDCLDRRCSCCADVVNDHYLSALLTEAFDTLRHAVLLFRLANEKAVDEPVAQNLAMSFLSAQSGYGDDDWVGAHGEAANCLRIPSTTANLVEEYASSQLGAVGVKGGGAAVDVVIASAAAGELEFS